jgi:hypothetical protein
LEELMTTVPERLLPGYVSTADVGAYLETRPA